MRIGRTGTAPTHTEDRFHKFAAGVASLEARSQLAASLVQAADEQRRRMARDLHDGAQSRLVLVVMALERARASDDLSPMVRVLIEEALMQTRAAIDELRELAHGIHPAILTNSGLAAAVEMLADRAPLPVQIAIPPERYPAPVESAAYFVAAEALTNIVKYACASRARIVATRTPSCLRLVVADNGVGGARREPGGGLAGLTDRLAALKGTLSIVSPLDAGTRITAEIPLGGAV
jgi:signal transduction histidine kinase